VSREAATGSTSLHERLQSSSRSQQAFQHRLPMTVWRFSIIDHQDAGTGEESIRDETATVVQGYGRSLDNVPAYSHGRPVLGVNVANYLEVATCSPFCLLQT